MENTARILGLQEHLEVLLTEEPPKSPVARWREALRLAAVYISTEFAVTENEVAMLVKTTDASGLRFAYPPNLAAGANVIPLRVWSFAGNVARTGIGAFDNAFAEKNI